MSLEEHLVEEPSWIKTLVDRAVEATEPLNLMGPFGFRWLEPKSEVNPSSAWIVAVYPTPNESYGGQHDGRLLYPGFNLNLSFLFEGFTSVGDLAWHNPTVYNGELDGPHISIQGFFAGYPVWFRMFHLPPQDEEATIVVDLANGDWWEKVKDQSTGGSGQG